jgi:eukaryotic-like serine/threonine-protein kinase
LAHLRIRKGPAVSSPVLAGMSARYEIVRELGRGGVAVVYLALDHATDRRVAIKVLRREFVASVSAARFLREISYLRALQHPNILPILDAAHAGELLYFVMPYATGQTLRVRLEREGALAMDSVVGIVSELASALDFAHGHNIVHRDLKPENILFDEGRTILSDFGVARAMVLSSSEERLSSSGIVVGTPWYMSPEQFMLDAPIDGRCDIYALGCVTYEMLTGEVPFPAVSAIAQAMAHASSSPRPIRTVRPEVPAHVEAAVFRAMAKRVVDRPPSGQAFVGLLLAPGRSGGQAWEAHL